MDKEIIFFIIFVVFSILSSLLNRKKKSAGPPPAQGESDQPGTPRRKKPFSFEDILREFEAEAMGKPMPDQEEEVLAPEREREEYRSPKKDRPVYAQSAEEFPSVYETYEGTSYENLDETLEKVMEKNDQLARETEVDERVPNEYAEILNDPDNLKKAFVMKEILDRRYI